jgi:uncharacterized protein (DUF169 family)
VYLSNMTNTDIQTELVQLLDLAHAPVAISFTETEPVGITAFDEPMSEPTADGRSGRVPASCVFWAHGHDNTFSTVPADHGNCSVGRFTHGFAEAGEILDKADVGTLLEVGWVTLEAFADVAALDWSPAHVVYGPLAESDGTPDVVLLRVTPRQMMEIGDAVPVEFSGKPQCQIIPRAAKGAVEASMGCALSRERIGMGANELTCAIPGARLPELVEALRSVCRADDAVVGYAAADRRRFDR